MKHDGVTIDQALCICPSDTFPAIEDSNRIVEEEDRSKQRIRRGIRAQIVETFALSAVGPELLLEYKKTASLV